MIFVLFCVKKNGWGWENFRKEVNDGKGLKISNKLQFYMTYILPAIIVIVYLKGYYDSRLKPSTAGSDSAMISTILKITAFFLLQPPMSI